MHTACTTHHNAHSMHHTRMQHGHTHTHIQHKTTSPPPPSQPIPSPLCEFYDKPKFVCNFNRSQYTQQKFLFQRSVFSDFLFTVPLHLPHISYCHKFVFLCINLYVNGHLYPVASPVFSRRDIVQLNPRNPATLPPQIPREAFLTGLLTRRPP